MTTKEFIEKAIEGGYNGYPKPFCIECGNYEAKNGGDLFLDPKAWEAVGKVEFWFKEVPVYENGKLIDADYPKTYPDKMHQMIDHLVSGGTIESYLETL